MLTRCAQGGQDIMSSMWTSSMNNTPGTSSATPWSMYFSTTLLISPIVILASNRGVCTIRGTDGITAPHGVPTDLLGRLLIIPTYPYEAEDIKTIVQIRAKTEQLNIDEAAISTIADIGVKASLRYALQLMTPASVIAKSMNRTRIEVSDVQECQELFIDAGRSSALTEQAGIANGFIS